MTGHSYLFCSNVRFGETSSVGRPFILTYHTTFVFLPYGRFYFKKEIRIPLKKAIALWLANIAICTLAGFGINWILNRLIPEDQESFQFGLTFGLGFVALFFGTIYGRVTNVYSETGVRFEVWPLGMSSGKLNWSHVKSARLVRNLGWFGGSSLSGARQAYHLANSTGIEFVAKNGDVLVLGTRQPEHVAELLRGYGIEVAVN